MQRNSNSPTVKTATALLLLTALPLAAQDTTASAKAAADIAAWTKLPRDGRPAMPAAEVPLTNLVAGVIVLTFGTTIGMLIFATRRTTGEFREFTPNRAQWRL